MLLKHHFITRDFILLSFVSFVTALHRRPFVWSQVFVPTKRQKLDFSNCYNLPRLLILCIDQRVKCKNTSKDLSQTTTVYKELPTRICKNKGIPALIPSTYISWLLTKRRELSLGNASSLTFELTSLPVIHQQFNSTLYFTLYKTFTQLADCIQVVRKQK